MKKRNITIFVIVAVFAAVCSYLVYSLYHPETGTRSGRVIDGFSREPIAGAVVVCAWSYGEFLAAVEPRVVSYETITDEEGFYFIPNRRVKIDSILPTGLGQESVLIYKDGYAVYTLLAEYDKSGKSYGYPNRNQKFRRRNNLVELYPLKNGESYREHITWIIDMACAMGAGTGTLLQEELKPERKRAEAESIGK
ncbi:MAG: carboxypeptidase-like regulatory domain-containing protein [Planctomycetota bacterium]